jgi:hypothetical protein
VSRKLLREMLGKLLKSDKGERIGQSEVLHDDFFRNVEVSLERNG